MVRFIEILQIWCFRKLGYWSLICNVPPGAFLGGHQARKCGRRNQKKPQMWPQNHKLWAKSCNRGNFILTRCIIAFVVILSQQASWSRKEVRTGHPQLGRSISKSTRLRADLSGARIFQPHLDTYWLWAMPRLRIKMSINTTRTQGHETQV